MKRYKIQYRFLYFFWKDSHFNNNPFTLDEAIDFASDTSYGLVYRVYDTETKTVIYPKKRKEKK